MTRSENVTWHPTAVARGDRPSIGATVWFTGLSGSGKSTVAVEVERLLVASGRPAYLLDGDNVRHGLNGDLGFSADDRAENVRRVGHVARLLADAGLVAVVPLISPYRRDRDLVRGPARRSAAARSSRSSSTRRSSSASSATRRASTRKARAGAITGFTGIDDPYEAPEAPELVLRPDDGDPAAMAARVLALLAS